MFEPKLFIGVGANACFFTLRETYEHISYFRNEEGFCGTVNGVFVGGVQKEIRSRHHFNLSQDPDAAFEKAKSFADENGMELLTTRESLAEEMNEIKRMTQAQREQYEANQASRAAAWAEHELKALAEKYAMLDSGLYPFGQYKGKPLREASIGYINWLASETFEPQTLIDDVAVAVKAVCKDLILPKPNQAFIGEPKQRREFSAVVTRKGGYPSDYGYVNIITMVADSGECLLVKSTSFSADLGERLKFKATIKEHSIYNGQNQTIIQRLQAI